MDNHDIDNNINTSPDIAPGAAAKRSVASGPHITGNATYWLEGDDIIRAGEKVATYNRRTGKVEFANEAATDYRVQIIRMLAEQKINVSGYVLAEDATAAANRAGDPAIPPMPRKNPKLGDKTPAVVEWYREYQPEEYRIRYGLHHSMAEFPVFDEATGKVITRRHCDVAERKTHLSERVADTTLDPTYDWSAE